MSHRREAAHRARSNRRRPYSQIAFALVVGLLITGTPVAGSVPTLNAADGASPWTVTPATPAVLPAPAATTPASGGAPGTPVVSSTGATLNATADTYVVKSQPTVTHGSRASMFATSGENRAFVRFATAGAVPAGKQIDKATLKVYVVNTAVTTAGFEVHPTTNGWQEATLTAASRPAYVAKAVSAAAAVKAKGAWLSVPLTDLTSVSTTAATSFELLHRTTNSRLQLATRESGKAAQLVLTFVAKPATGGGGGGTTPPPATTGTLPFDKPAASVLAASPKLAFAHYFTPFPISLDNKDPAADYYTKNYLTTNGESGKHSAYGGLLRDRPIGRSPLAGDYAATDFETDVKQARAAGLDGFTVDVLSLTSYNWTRVVKLLEAAHRADPTFKIMLMPDMTTLDDETPAALAKAMDTLGRYPAAFHLGDGRLVVSPFKAEAKTAAWWSSWITLMKSSHNTTVAFVPTFLDWQKYAASFASISYGFSAWGMSSPATNTTGAAHVEKARAMGKLFMAPAKVQDERPSQGEYQEAGNTETLRLSWQGVIDGGAGWVDMPTWNDYSEGTSIAPSAHHGWSFLDITSYYLTQWKTGKAPAIVRDALYVSHRNQLVGAKPAFASSKPMVLRSGSTPARDTVEVLAFLTKDATVTVKIGSATYTWDAPAGLHAKTFPLRAGQVSASAARAGTTTTSVTSPFPVLAQPPVQDMQYDAVSSLRR